MKDRRYTRGFTLIEIIVVLAVLGVLAAVVVPNLTGFLSRGKDRAFESDQRLLQATVDAWRTDISQRAGNPWPTMDGTKGTPADNTNTPDGDYVDSTTGAGQTVADVNSFLKISLLTTGTYLKGNDVVKSYKYANTAVGATGAPSTSVGSYLWYIDTNGLVKALRWNDADADNLVDSGETTSGFVSDVYP